MFCSMVIEIYLTAKLFRNENEFRSRGYTPSNMTNTNTVKFETYDKQEFFNIVNSFCYYLLKYTLR